MEFLDFFTLDATTLIIMLSSFLASAFSAAFGFGGVFIIIGGMSLVLPMSAILPVQSASMMASQLSRALMLRQYIEWSFVKPFVIGSVGGAILGALLYTNLPASVVGIVLSGVMLWAAWGPTKRKPIFNVPHAGVLVGAIHAFIATAFSFGGFLQAALFRENFTRQQITATIGTCVLAMALIRLPAYAGFGFDYWPYIKIVLACWIVAPFGTWIGRHFLNKMPEIVFRYGFKALLTIIAIRLLWKVLAPLIS